MGIYIKGPWFSQTPRPLEVLGQLEVIGQQEKVVHNIVTIRIARKIYRYMDPTMASVFQGGGGGGRGAGGEGGGGGGVV